MITMSTVDLFEDLGRFGKAIGELADKFGVEKPAEPPKSWSRQGEEAGLIGADSATPPEVVAAGINAIEEWQAGYWCGYYRDQLDGG